jgi:DNA invertase Pin-like site-specific DNA recombinase
MTGRAKHVAIYARVSTRDKDQNPETQLLQLREYAARKSFTIAQEYVDRVSGRKESRLALDQLMHDARRGRFDAIIVWRFDRFGRTVKQLILALEEFRELEIGFVSLSESIDTTTPYGKLLYVVIAAFAEFILDITRDNVCAGLHRARKEGKQLGRPRVEVDPLQVAGLRARGLSWNQIAGELGIGRGTAERAFRTLPKNPPAQP